MGLKARLIVQKLWWQQVAISLNQIHPVVQLALMVSASKNTYLHLYSFKF